MGLFGNKKQEQLDTSQDQQLKQLWMWITQLNKNQEVLIKNNSYFIAKLKELEKRIADGEKLDATQQAAIDGLVNTAIDIQKAAKETSAES